MSLVNDMLRDLDARRRDTPARGLGAEKLVPAAERSAKQTRVRFSIIALVLAFVFAGLLALYLVMISSQSGQLSAPSQRLPMAESEAPLEQPVLEQELIAQAAAVASQLTTESLSQLEIRLQQLEAQNQALLESQQRREQEELAQAQRNMQAATQLPSVTESLAQPVFNADQQYSQEWADAPALPVESAQPAQTSGFNAGVSANPATTRSPRELSFQDRDRQQVQLALQQWASGQQLTALQTLDSFAYQYPDAHNSRETLAKLLIQQGETERAMHAVELGLALVPNNNAYRKIKARLLVADARAAEAVELLVNMAPAVTSDTEYHDLLASSYLSSEQYGFAAQTYQTLLQLNQAEGRWWYGLAAAFDAEGRSQDAANAYERALQQANLSAGLRQTSQQRLQLIRQSSAAR